VELYTIDESGNLGPYQIRFHEVAYERALLYYEIENWNEALTDFQFCIKNSYMVEPSIYMCGAIYEIFGMLEQACNEYNIAASMGDQDAIIAKKELCDK